MDLGVLWEYAADFAKVATGAIGVMLLGFYKAKITSDKNDMMDRSEFTNQLMARLKDVEDRLEHERTYCETRIKEQAVLYERVITELNDRIEFLEQNRTCDSCQQRI